MEGDRAPTVDECAGGARGEAQHGELCVPVSSIARGRGTPEGVTEALLHCNGHVPHSGSSGGELKLTNNVQTRVSTYWATSRSGAAATPRSTVLAMPYAGRCN